MLALFKITASDYSCQNSEQCQGIIIEILIIFSCPAFGGDPGAAEEDIEDSELDTTGIYLFASVFDYFISKITILETGSEKTYQILSLKQESLSTVSYFVIDGGK